MVGANMNEWLKAKTTKILEHIKENPYSWALGIVILFVSIPILINWLYMLGSPSGQPNTTFSSGEVIAFYGSFLAFFGTFSLGTLSLWQAKKANATNKAILQQDIQIRTKSYLKPTWLFLSPESITEPSSIQKTRKFHISNHDTNVYNYVSLVMQFKSTNAEIRSIKVHRLSITGANIYTYQTSNPYFETVIACDMIQYTILAGFQGEKNIIDELKACNAVRINLDAVVQNIFGVCVEAQYVFTVNYDETFQDYSTRFAVNVKTSQALIGQISGGGT